MAVILITGALDARAYRLKTQFKDDTVLLGDYADVPQVMINNGSIIKLPNPSSASYLHDMLALCLDKDIDKICLMHSAEQTAMAQATQLFNEFEIELLAADEV